MKVSVKLAVFPSFEGLQKVGCEIDIPEQSPGAGLHLVSMYDDGSISMPQHMLAVVVGTAANRWQVVSQSTVNSPIGDKEIITVEFSPLAFPLYVGRERVDLDLRHAAGLPIIDPRLLCYGPPCYCVHLVLEDGDRSTEPQRFHDISSHN